MKLYDYASLSFASLKERKGRTIGAILGVMIAVIALSLALGIGQAFQNIFEERLERTFLANSIFVTGGKGFTDADLAYFGNIYGVRDVFGVAVRNVRIAQQKGEVTATLIAIDPRWIPQFIGVNSLQDFIEEGTSDIKGLGVIVGNDLWKDPDTGTKIRDVGEIVTVSVAGRSAREITFYIVGLGASTGGFRGMGANPDNSIFMDPDAFFTYITKRRVYNLAVVVVNNTEDVKYIIDEIRAVAPQGSRIFSPVAMIQQVSIFVTSLQTILALISSVGIGVTALWVFDSMTISVVQRTKEIGILKAIGYRSRDILLLFLLEAIFISLIGSIAGLTVSMIISNFVGIPIFGSMVLKADLTPTIVFLAVILPILTNVFAAFFPSRRAANLNPVEALRYE
ncbi:MAG: ABC transporter permease [Thermoproteales archaeon]|nr:ABC transporter permease [Thermoproteales archaeon]